ncbi:MAG TPA: SRPBCC domain-containing protein [Verrucomicrobiae bacterium]|nr:SRPBCC domain-containing protein [Verrucomicrobiae bacterium]
MAREIWHEIHIKASPKDVYAAVTEVKKLANWWTTDTRGQSLVGQKLEFWFYGHFSAEMVVTTLTKNKLVRWRVTERGIPDWANTEIEFKIFRRGEYSYLHLRHSKWRDDTEMFPECSMHWAIFLLSLKEFVETGRGRPHPYDMPVNIDR